MTAYHNRVIRATLRVRRALAQRLTSARIAMRQTKDLKSETLASATLSSSTQVTQRARPASKHAKHASDLTLITVLPVLPAASGRSTIITNAFVKTVIMQLMGARPAHHAITPVLPARVRSTPQKRARPVPPYSSGRS